MSRYRSSSMLQGSSTGGAVLAGCLLLLLLIPLFIFLGALFYGWIIMLAIGATHSIWNWPSKTVGYWPCVGLGAIFSILTGAVRGRVTSS